MRGANSSKSVHPGRIDVKRNLTGRLLQARVKVQTTTGQLTARVVRSKGPKAIAFTPSTNLHHRPHHSEMTAMRISSLTNLQPLLQLGLEAAEESTRRTSASASARRRWIDGSAEARARRLPTGSQGLQAHWFPVALRQALLHRPAQHQALHPSTDWLGQGLGK